MTTRTIPAERANAMLSFIKEFQCLSHTDIEMVAAACQWHRYEAGNEIVRNHDHTNSANSAFFIAQGKFVSCTMACRGKRGYLCDLPTGEMFGELTAIDGYPRSSTVIARTSVLLASMHALDFQDLIYSNHQIAESF